MQALRAASTTSPMSVMTFRSAPNRFPSGFASAASVAFGLASTPLVAQTGDPCGSWAQTAVPGLPGSLLSDAAVVSPNLAFAVGNGFEGSPSPLPLFRRFDGATWSTLLGPPIPGPFGSQAPLFGVEALSSTDVWIVGSQGFSSFNPQCNTNKARIARWNGALWSEMPAFQLIGDQPCDSSQLYAVEAIGSQLWFVGRRTPLAGCGGGLALRWNGTSMEFVPTPCVALPPGSLGYELYAVAGVAQNDVWAVGGGNVPTSPMPGMIPNPGYIIHWDGVAWSQVLHQAPGQFHRLTAVDAYASNDVWALGQYLENGVLGSFATHWDGSAWTPMIIPGGTRGLVVQNPQSIHAVGNGVYYFDGQTWTQVETFPGSVPQNQVLTIEDIEPLGLCDFLVVGRTSTAAGSSPLLFAARLSPKPDGVQALSGCAGGVLSGSLQAIQPPQLGSTLALGMDDTTGFGGLISGVSQPFVFVSTAGSSACGTPLPGFGPGGQTGELLIDLGQLALTAPLGVGPWTGPGTPSTISLPLADKPAFAGLSFFAQGLWVTPNPVLNLLLSNGLKLTLGY